ncbi:major facilitator superfamily domain-containing protein 8-like [Tubulanus polymorphus]|uniref:major facilitator superfamily domain-containing protein 8-like n=1 Tax=Tubulanus polymorphus TaxID=672921 RepID=UPI003DA3F0E0
MGRISYFSRSTSYGSMAVGVPSTVLEPPNVYKSRWRSIRVMYLTMFLSSISFSICMSSIWPFLRVVDLKTSTDFLGWVIAAYSIGQFFASPLFGFWANCRESSKEPLIITIVISTIGNLMYAYIQDFPSPRRYYLLAARALIGFGAGNVAVVRSYVSGATTIKERTSALAHVSAAQAIGFILGPALQAAFVSLGYPGIVEIPEIHINFYTATGFVSAILSVINLILVVVVFGEYRVHDDNTSPSIANVQDSSSSQSLLHKDTPDVASVISCNILFFVVLFVFSIFETIATPLSMDMFGWTKEQATLYTGIMLACSGVLAICIFIGVKYLSKKMNERYILLGGFIFCLLSFITYLPWGKHYPAIEPTDIIPIHPDNGTTTEPSTGAPPVGCPMIHSWCFTTPKIYLAQFLAATALLSIGYPTTNVMTYSIYSKVLGPRPQGTQMGWITASGSSARTLGPVFVSYVYDSYGPRYIFASVSGVLLLTVIFTFSLILLKRLLPFKSARIVVGRSVGTQ